MPEARAGAKLFALPPGADFPKALIQGLFERFPFPNPLDLARVRIFVSTRRMQRRIIRLLTSGDALILPRVDVISDIGASVFVPGVPPAMSPLRLRLELAQLVARLIEAEPDLAPRSAAFDLADSLADLMGEMHGEGIGTEAIRNLDVADLSGHWQRALRFINIVQQHFEDPERPDTESRQRMVVKHLVRQWKENPPDYPVIIAGSTGSRGTTRLLLEAVACQPQGAVILPGFDFDLPPHVWLSLDDVMTAEDHPQFRFRALMKGLSLESQDIELWTESAKAPCPARNRLVSLALRPAPVTDAWLEEGPKMADISDATAQMTLIEAPSPRAEALAIAFKLRECAETGRTAALITPDRTLTRRVSALLDRWNIEPDDSAGEPLPLSPPGRFLRQIAALFGQKLTSERLLALLKHPLAAGSEEIRGRHLSWTRALELDLRRNGPSFPTPESLQDWAANSEPADNGRFEWAVWLGSLLEGLEKIGTRSLSAHLEHHIALAENLAAGPGAKGSGALWLRKAGETALRAVSELRSEVSHGGSMCPADYAALFHAVLDRHEIRDPLRPYPGIMIWGTLEARVQGADLVILAGLNEGTWPSAAPADPWLNREMRKQAGLLLPDRQIGLAAHDFQQAVAAQEVILCRSIRDDETETVPSRWLNRLTNLLAGLGKEARALEGMRQRGEALMQLAAAFEKPAPVPAAARPSPRPPVEVRPKRLSVTRIETLIRDPYAIYAEYILRLRPLDPLKRRPDAALRGTVLHTVFERFIRERPKGPRKQAKDKLLEIAENVFEHEVPWPAIRYLWLARMARIADDFLKYEEHRARTAEPIALEIRGEAKIPTLDFTLVARADRIDRGKHDGTLLIYDYKTGTAPSRKMQKYFQKQLLLTAAMIERGAFRALGKNCKVAKATYIRIGASYSEQSAPLDSYPPDRTWKELGQLVGAYLERERGFTSCRAIETLRHDLPYQHLARFGEWDLADEPVPEKVE